jgi:hypothetical protein
MRQVTRQDVVQAMGTLGVRLSGSISSSRFEEARQAALDAFKPLMRDSHPDRHAASGDGNRATFRAQEISAAQHLVKSCHWSRVGSLFRDRSGAREWTVEVENMRKQSSRIRYYKRCPRCGRLNREGDQHFCGTKVDPVAASVRECGDESPLGVRCAEILGHRGWHRGYSKRGRHVWREKGMYSSEEKVDVGIHRDGGR